MLTQTLPCLHMWTQRPAYMNSDTHSSIYELADTPTFAHKDCLWLSTDPDGTKKHGSYFLYFGFEPIRALFLKSIVIADKKETVVRPLDSSVRMY